MGARADILPIAVGEKRAAQMLDLPVTRFREYVREGVLPGPRTIGRDKRWPVDELRRIVRGEDSDGLERTEW